MFQTFDRDNTARAVSSISRHRTVLVLNMAYLPKAILPHKSLPDVVAPARSLVRINALWLNVGRVHG